MTKQRIASLLSHKHQECFQDVVSILSEYLHLDLSLLELYVHLARLREVIALDLICHSRIDPTWYNSRMKKNNRRKKTSHTKCLRKSKIP